MKKKITIVMTFLSIFLLSAADYPNLKDFKKFSSAGNSESHNLFGNGDFENGGADWELQPEFAQTGPYGCNGNGGLRLHWEQKDISPALAIQNVRLYPDRNYVVSCKVRTQELKGAGNSKIRLQLVEPKSGKILYSRAIYKGKPDQWKTLKAHFNTNGFSGETACMLKLFFAASSMGTMDFDEFELYEDLPSWKTHVVSPRRAWFDPNGETLELASLSAGFNYPGVEDAELFCLVELNSKTQAVPVVKQRFQLELPPAPTGDAVLHLTLIDKTNKLILAQHDLKILRRTIASAPRTTIDSMGRTVVNGQPFLPVGIYSSSLSNRELDILKGTPFNVCLPYGSLSMRLSGTKKSPPDAIRAVLDRAEKQGLKVIFSIKGLYPNLRNSVKEWNGLTDHRQIIKVLTDNLKDHPALLAWYVADEIPGSFIPQMEERRCFLGENDPDHPTFAVYHQPSHFGAYASSQDIFGVDPYPIRNHNNRDMRLVYNHLSRAGQIYADSNGNMALYMVPQVFSWGVYDAETSANLERFNEKYRYPTAHEMLSMSVLGAILGAKGFIFYSLQDIFLRGPDKEQAARRWPEVCAVAGELRKLAPFILSGEPPPKFQLDVRRGKVEARAFKAADGSVAILTAGIGPDESEAVITLDSPLTLYSTTGKTIGSENRYVFKGKDICSDILLTR